MKAGGIFDPTEILLWSKLVGFNLAFMVQCTCGDLS
ncbi:hypothetical protein TH47_18735 [Thalassospira sp. MCCC 1A02803]|nr:hypothetical protein TH47_18735 [Thalassospira sp. MCCC 1A02803]